MPNAETAIGLKLVKPASAMLERHKTIVATLISQGGWFLESRRNLAKADAAILAMFDITEEGLRTILRNLEDSYATWHVEFSQTDEETLQTLFGLGSQPR